ncbi:helix-turn-helix domain-containing protein [Streptomyces sp. NPDC005438]|uniref:helix-turn-helix domain-containing protein n=1 Tax=Streptomyces sp. NPDC005438 TaxID=3156880 RepID=UPI0033BC6247
MERVNGNPPDVAALAEFAATRSLTVSVAEASRVVGVGTSTAYEAIKRGDFPFQTIKVGGKVRVVTASIVRVLSGEPDPTPPAAALQAA